MDEEKTAGIGKKHMTISLAQRHRSHYVFDIVSVVVVVVVLFGFIAIYFYQGAKKNMELYRIIVGQLEVNCFILADKNTKEAVIIDPGEDAQDILKIIKEYGLTIKYIVNTHGHFDHIGANKALKEATGAALLIHEGDAMLMQSAPLQASAFGMESGPSPKADRYVKHGDILTAGEISLTVLHTPGHSPGGISLLEQGVVFTGDTLFAGSIGRSDLPGGDLMTLIRSIRKNLLTLPDDTKVFCGHGPATTIGDERKENPFLNKESGFE
jgi:hydroxyacylglutathione hydrolase